MSKSSALLRRLCCCCCCDDTSIEQGLLSSQPSKETTPSQDLQGISEVRVCRDLDGDEIQEMEVSVEDERRGQETPVVLRPKPAIKTSLVVEGPSERARVDSGTFVRNSGSRSSWRLVPTVTQQAREAAVAKEKAEMEEKRKSAILTSSSNLGDGAIVFSGEAIEEEERHVTLVPEEVGGALADNKGVASVTVLVSQGEISDGPEQVVITEDDAVVDVVDPVEHERKIQNGNSSTEIKGQSLSEEIAFSLD